MAALAAQAAPIAYDGIAYPPGVLSGRGPAFGFVAPWAADPGVMVVYPGLVYPMALPPSGGAVAGDFNFLDPLLLAQVPSPGKEFWASFLIQHTGPNDETYMGLSSIGAIFGDPPAVGIGVRLGQYGIFVGGAFTPCAKAYTPAGSTDFLVAHFTAAGGVWIVQLFVNPSSFLVPDLVMNVAAITYGTMTNLNELEFESDEFRLGDLPTDVSAIGPTPTKASSWTRLKQLYK
jgi:hypothetical protein